MKLRIAIVIAAVVLVAASAFQGMKLRQRSKQIAALKREMAAALEKKNAEREQLRKKTFDWRDFERPPVGDFLTPLERSRLSRNTAGNDDGAFARS